MHYAVTGKPKYLIRSWHRLGIDLPSALALGQEGVIMPDLARKLKIVGPDLS